MLQAQQLDDAHGDAADHHIPFCSLECLYDPLLLMAVPHLCQRVSAAFPAAAVQPGDRMCPEMVTESSELLLHLPEHGLDLKTAGICLYDISRRHGQVRTCQDGLCLSILYKDELQGLVQALSPQVCPGKETDIPHGPVNLKPCSLERLAMPHKKILQIDRRSVDRAAATPFIRPRLFISRTVPLCPCDDMEQAWGLCGARLPLHEHGLRQKVTVQDKKGHPDVPCGTESIAEYLHHMGDGLIPKPIADGSISIMDLDGLRQAESLGGNLRLLHHLFGAGHIPPVRGTFHPHRLPGRHVQLSVLGAHGWRWSVPRQ